MEFAFNLISLRMYDPAQGPKDRGVESSKAMVLEVVNAAYFSSMRTLTVVEVEIGDLFFFFPDSASQSSSQMRFSMSVSYHIKSHRLGT